MVWARIIIAAICGGLAAGSVVLPERGVSDIPRISAPPYPVVWSFQTRNGFSAILYIIDVIHLIQ